MKWIIKSNIQKKNSIKRLKFPTLNPLPRIDNRFLRFDLFSHTTDPIFFNVRAYVGKLTPRKTILLEG